MSYALHLFECTCNSAAQFLHTAFLCLLAYPLCTVSMRLLSFFDITKFSHQRFLAPLFPLPLLSSTTFIFLWMLKNKKIFLDCWKEMMETFFQSSIDTRGGVLSLKINIVIKFKQGSDFKPGLLCNQNLHASKLLWNKLQDLMLQFKR